RFMRPRLLLVLHVDQRHTAPALLGFRRLAQTLVKSNDVGADSFDANLGLRLVERLDDDVAGAHDPLEERALHDVIDDAIEIDLLELLSEDPGLDDDALRRDPIVRAPRLDRPDDPRDAERDQRDERAAERSERRGMSLEEDLLLSRCEQAGGCRRHRHGLRDGLSAVGTELRMIVFELGGAMGALHAASLCQRYAFCSFSSAALPGHKSANGICASGVSTVLAASCISVPPSSRKRSPVGISPLS